MNRMTKPTSRGGLTDLLRFLFSLMVLIYHSYSFSSSPKTALGTGGYIGVDFFFILSGVYLAASAGRKNSPVTGDGAGTSNVGLDTLNYMGRRLSRIYPEFIVAMLIALFAGMLLNIRSLGTIPKALNRAIGEWTMLQQSGFHNTGGIVSATWYLSALLITSLLLYPMARKYRDGFLYVLAPLIFIALFGYTWQNLKTLQNPKDMLNSVICQGLLRGIMEMALGCFIYGLARKAEGLRLKPVPRGLLTLVECAIYVGILIFYMTGKHKNKLDWNIVLLLGLAQLITQSKLSFSDEYIKGRLFTFLGAFSFDLYLGHRFWSINLNSIRFLAPLSYHKKLIAYFLISMAAALVIMYGARLLRWAASRLLNWAVMPEQSAKDD